MKIAKKMNSWFRMPNGKSTQNPNELMKEWNSILNPLKQHFGAKVIGFDPGVLISFERHSVNLPVGFVIALSAKLKELDRLKKKEKERSIRGRKVSTD